MFEICVDILKESELAYLVSDSAITVWIPKSQIKNLDYNNPPTVGDNVLFEIPEWLAIEKEFI